MRCIRLIRSIGRELTRFINAQSVLMEAPGNLEAFIHKKNSLVQDGVLHAETMSRYKDTVPILQSAQRALGSNNSRLLRLASDELMSAIGSKRIPLDEKFAALHMNYELILEHARIRRDRAIRNWKRLGRVVFKQ